MDAKQSGVIVKLGQMDPPESFCATSAALPHACPACWHVVNFSTPSGPLGREQVLNTALVCECPVVHCRKFWLARESGARDRIKRCAIDGHWTESSAETSDDWASRAVSHYV